MELTHNLSIPTTVYERPTHRQQHDRSFRDAQPPMRKPVCAQTDAHCHKTEIRLEWIMKLLLTPSTYDLLSITQMDTTLFYWSQPPSLSLLRCSCRFSSRYLSAHLHRSADGFRGRWWDYKSAAAPSDYHQRDQLRARFSSLKTPNVLIGNNTHLLRHAQWMSSSSSLHFLSRWKSLSLSLSLFHSLTNTHTHRQRERVMGYKSNNGIPSLMWGAGPIRRPVSHENVSNDLEGLEQVYDIISVLPQQRYCSESPDGLIFPQGLTLCKQSQSAGIGHISKCFILSQTEWDTSDRAAA